MDSYKITFHTWDKVAGIYQDKFMDLDLYNDTYDTFCKLVSKQNARIFEIGCGPGNITRYLLAKRPDLKIDAIDIAPNMIELAKENNPAAHFEVMDCRNIGSLTARYDGIMCGFCLPYLSKQDCAQLIHDSANLLNDGGILYLSAIEDDYERSGYEANSAGDKMYIYYHQENFLQESLKTNNFELVELIRKAYSKADGTSSSHMIFIARKK